jgi:hypothetical protein
MQNIYIKDTNIYNSQFLAFVDTTTGELQALRFVDAYATMLNDASQGLPTNTMRLVTDPISGTKKLQLLDNWVFDPASPTQALARSEVDLTNLNILTSISKFEVAGLDLLLEYTDEAGTINSKTIPLSSLFTATIVNDTLTSTSTTEALSAKQGKTLNGNDIASGALVGNNLVLTKKDATTITIDATAMLADVRVSSGLYNSTTKALDFTLSDSSVISVPVSALLPVTHDNTLSGDGSTTPLKVELSTDANNLIILGTDGKLYGSADAKKMNKTTGTVTGAKVLLSSGTTGINNVESTVSQAWLESNHSVYNSTIGSIDDTNPDTTVTQALASYDVNNNNLPDLVPTEPDRFYINEALTGNNKVTNFSTVKRILSEKLEVAISTDANINYGNGINVNYSLTDSVNTINLALISDYVSLTSNPNIGNVTGELSFTNFSANTVRLVTQGTDEIYRSGENRYDLAPNESVILGLVYDEISTFNNKQGYKVLASNKTAVPQLTSSVTDLPNGTVQIQDTQANAQTAIRPIDELTVQSAILTDEIVFKNGTNHRKTNFNQVKTLLAALDDVVDVTGVTFPIAYPTTTLPGTPVFSPNTPGLTTAIYALPDGSYVKFTGTQYISAPAPTTGTPFVKTGTTIDAGTDKITNITRTGFIGSAGKTPTSSITGSSLAMNIVNTVTPYTTTPNDHTVRVSSGVTGGITLHPSVNTRGQIMVLINDNAVPCPMLGQQLITHNASPVVVTSIPANTSYTIQELNGNWITIDSDQPQKNLAVINTAQPTPTATGNTTNLNSTFKDVLGDTWIVDNAGVAIKAAGSALDFFRSGTGTTLPDGTTDTTENVSRIGKIGFGLIDPTALTSTVDIVGTLDTRPVSVASVPVLVPNSGTSYNTFDIPNAIVDANSNIQVTGVAVDTVLNIGQPSTLNATTNALYVGRYLRVHNADSSTARLLFREIEILPGQFLDLQHNGRYWEVETNYLNNWEGFEFTGTQISIPAFSSGTTTYVDVPSAQFVAPTPGDYWVKYTLYAANSAIMPTKAGNDVKFVTDNVAGTFVPIVGSVSEIGNATGATIDPYTKYFRVRTIRANQVVKMQLNSIIGSTTTYQSATQLSTIDFKRFTTPVISSATALKKFRVVQNLVTGANLITDNLGLTTPFARNVEVRLDSTGELIACRVTLETNNTVTITTTAPVTGARITIIG